MIDSKLKTETNQDDGHIDIGFYFNELDVLEFDMGTIETEKS
jgi:hypothetical protein